MISLSEELPKCFPRRLCHATLQCPPPRPTTLLPVSVAAVCPGVPRWLTAAICVSCGRAGQPSVPRTAGEKLGTRDPHGTWPPRWGGGPGVPSCHVTIRNAPFPTTSTRRAEKQERATQTQAKRSTEVESINARKL